LENQFVKKLNRLEKQFYLVDVTASYHFASKQCEPEFTENDYYKQVDNVANHKRCFVADNKSIYFNVHPPFASGFYVYQHILAIY